MYIIYNIYNMFLSTIHERAGVEVGTHKVQKQTLLWITIY